MKLSGSAFCFNLVLAYDRAINQGLSVIDSKTLTVSDVIAIIDAGKEQFPMNIRMIKLYGIPVNDLIQGCGLMTSTKAVCMLYNRVSFSRSQVETADDLLRDLVETGQDIVIAPGISIADAFLKGYGHAMIKDLNVPELKCLLHGMSSVNRSLELCQKALQFSGDKNRSFYESRIQSINHIKKRLVIKR
jgi:hypothetical protein